MNKSFSYPDALPHDNIQKLFPDIYMVQGSIKGGPVKFNRNMVIIRNDDFLTLINPVRLNPQEEKKLEGLGKIKHVFRQGSIHGRDDAYYVDKFSAEFWCLADSDKNYPEPIADPNHIFGVGTLLPIDDADLFVFKETKLPESALLIKRHGGILITCDCIQSWKDWNQCNFFARLIMPFLGFGLRTLIGGPWLKGMTTQESNLESEFGRLLEWEFDHLVGAHGGFCRGTAHQKVEAAVKKSFY